MTWKPHLRLVTIDEAAELVDRPASTIRRWISEGRMPVIAKQGRRGLVLEAHVLRVDGELASRDACGVSTRDATLSP